MHRNLSKVSGNVSQCERLVRSRDMGIYIQIPNSRLGSELRVQGLWLMKEGLLAYPDPQNKNPTVIAVG